MISQTLLTQIQEVTKNAEGSASIQEGMALLARAFSVFSDETTRLEQAYSKLQKKFKVVNAELEKSHHQLNDQVLQLDVVTHYLNNILRHMSQGILFIGHKGMITTYNAAAEKILGIKHTAVIFQSYWDVFPDDFFHFSMRLAHQKQASSELIYFTFGEKDLEIATTFIHKGLPSSQGIIILIRDVTEMRRLQKENGRKKRLQELGEIAASVAHEIQLPLEAIQRYASNLDEELDVIPKTQENVIHILEHSQRLNSLVDKVLHYARPLHLHKETVNLTELLHKVINDIDKNSDVPKHVHLDRQIKEHPIMMHLDELLISKAIQYLIVHSLGEMKKGGVLKIQLYEQKDKVILLISDSGAGMEQKNLEKIFTPQFTARENGSGMELSEAHKIIETHFGSIEVTSQLGQGTTFTITLPLRI